MTDKSDLTNASNECKITTTPDKQIGMTDAEIIKFIEHAMNSAVGEDGFKEIYWEKLKDILDLIKRQKAEIERLNANYEKLQLKYENKVNDNKFLKRKNKEAESEAIKELENRLYSYLGVGHLRPPTEVCFSEIAVKQMIERVIKEMMGFKE